MTQPQRKRSEHRPPEPDARVRLDRSRPSNRDVHGILEEIHGGTAATTFQQAINNLTDAQAGDVGKVLYVDGSVNATWTAPLATIPDGDHGDITTSSSGTVWTIDDGAVTYAKMQDVSATDRLLGRDTAGSGDPEELTVGGGIEFTGSGGIQRSALTGDVTASAGSGSTSIPNGTVTYAKMQDVSATDKVLGRSSAGAGDVEEIACTSVGRALIACSDIYAAMQILEVGCHEQVSVFWQDFYGNSASPCGFAAATSGTGATVNQAYWAIDSSSNILGALYVGGGTSGTGFASMLTYNNVLLFNTGTRFILRVRLCIQNLATAADDYWFEVGFGNNLQTGTGTDLAVFRYKRSVSANWYAVTKKDGTETTTDSGVAAAAGTSNCVILEIDVAADGSSVAFDIDDAGGVATHTTNLPTNSTGDRMGMGMYIQQTAYASVDPWIAADWWRVEAIRTGAR